MASLIKGITVVLHQRTAVVRDDGAGNVTISMDKLTSHSAHGDVAVESRFMKVSDDGNGNVTVDIMGEDDFGAKIYGEELVKVENVLVGRPDVSEVAADLQMYGKRAEYELCIPKGDTHNWEDGIVEFFGQKWRTFGFCQEWIEEMVPLEWNKKIKVERYG